MGTATQAFRNLCIRRIFRSATTACQGGLYSDHSPFGLRRAPTSPYGKSARASFDNSIVGGFHPPVRRPGVSVVQPPAVVGAKRIG